LRNILDLSPREWAVFAPLIVLTLWMGIYPSSFTSYFDATVGAMVQNHTAALAAPTKLAGIVPTPTGGMPTLTGGIR
jgi:NADH-quinone oxidoreductase subunit M